MVVTFLQLVSESCQGVFVCFVEVRIGASIEVQLDRNADPKKGPGRPPEHAEGIV